ncbi:MAG: MFS transporter [Labilithrix sp.]|nr:MFS transporter [Labilithrix sp.]
MTLGGLPEIRLEERRNTFAAFLTLLALTTGHTLLETARDALFLAKIPASHLPWMYLVIVAIALALSQIRAARADGKMSVGVALIVAGGVTAVFWALLGKPTPALLYANYVWTGLFASWAMAQFWTLLGRAHTMTQAKRLYGFIGAGAVLGAVLGAVVARAAMMMFSPRTSVLISAAIFALSAVPCFALEIPKDQDAARPADEGPKRRRLAASFGLLWEHAFARRVLGIVLVATITFTLADYLFKSQLAREIRDPKELGAYLSSFYAVTNALALVAQLVVAPAIFRRIGVQRALFIFPATMLVAAAGFLATGGLRAAAVVLKGLDGVQRYSLHKTSTELLLVPVPDVLRERIKPMVELLGSRGGQAVASVGILLAVACSAADPITLGAIVLTLGVVWIALVVTIRAHYLDVFRETLRTGGLSGKAELPELDLGALETLFAGLNSSRDFDVLASLELLAEQHRERLIPALILYHPSRDVVLRALEIFTDMGRTDFVPIADRLNSHPDREVAAAALRARTAVAPNKQLLLERLDEPCLQVAATSLVALMARGWIAPEQADERLARALETPSWQTASELARAVRSVATKRGDDEAMEDRFDELLIRLDAIAGKLKEAACAPVAGGPLAAAASQMVTDARVRLEVARAMGVRKSPRFLPVLVKMLSRHELRATARAAILEIPGALDALDKAMSAAQVPREIRAHLPRTICLFESTAAARVLLRHLHVETDGMVRYKIIRGLVKLRRANPHLRLDDSALTRVVIETLDHAEELRRWSASLASNDDQAPGSADDPLRAAHHLLVDLVRDKELHATQRIFLLLELLYGDEFDDVWRGLRSKSPKRKASSLELVENIVRSPLRERVLALVGDARPGIPSRALTYEQALREILAHDSETMQILARYRAAELGLDVGDVATGAKDRALAASIGLRILETARDLIAPDPGVTGGDRAPA